MKPEIDTLLRFPMFKELRPQELAAISNLLAVEDFAPGDVLFDEGDLGDRMYFLHMGRIQIDRQTTPGHYEVLAELEPPAIIGEMAILREAPRSARGVAMKPSVLWGIDRDSLLDLANTGNAASYKIIRWIAASLSERLSRTNDKLIEIYSKPFKSIMELKERLKEVHPDIVSVGMDSDANE